MGLLSGTLLPVKMTDAAGDIVEEISFQNFDDDFELLDSLVDDALWGEVRDKFMEKKSRGIEFRLLQKKSTI